MDLKEYFEAQAQLQQDQMHPEFDTYVRTWVRQRFPEVHRELAATFKKDEALIYAHQQQPQGELF